MADNDDDWRHPSSTYPAAVFPRGAEPTGIPPTTGMLCCLCAGGGQYIPAQFVLDGASVCITHFTQVLDKHPDIWWTTGNHLSVRATIDNARRRLEADT
jgi:hypothetical protein